MSGSGIAKIFLFAGLGIGLVGAGIVIGKSDFSFSSPTQTLNGFHLLAEIPRQAQARDEKSFAQTTPAQVVSKPKKITPTVASAVETISNVASASSSVATSSKIVFAIQTAKAELGPPVSVCHFATTQFPNYQNLVLNEVAWMGTPEDSGNEWIELRNASDTAISTENYWVLDKAEQIKAHLPALVLGPGDFFLLERGDDAVPSSTADVIYTGGLSNSNESVRLFDPWCNLVDQAIGEPKWPAGNATQKRTMERGGDWTWYTYVGDAVNGILGTPKAKNTAPNTAAGQFIAPPVVSSSSEVAVAEHDSGAATSTDTTSSSAAVASVDELASDGETGDASTASQPSDPFGLNHIVISAVQITGGAGHTTDDYVEFYNPTAQQFNLKGYRLVKRTKVGTSDTSIKSWTDDAFIPSGGKYRWANTGYPGSADMRTSGSIADDNAVALRKGGEDTGEIIDAVGWGAASNALVESSPFSTNPTAGQTLSRKQWVDTNNNASDFELR